MKPATAGGPYRVPPEPSRWPAITLAVAVHALLLAFLWFGINWQNNEPVQVEAEVWDMKVQAAAPPPPPPEEVEPQPEPEPAPAPKVVEQPVEQPVAAPDINLEREKQRKEQLKQQQEEREREAAKAREEEKAKELADKKAAEKKLAQEKKEAEKKAADEKKKAEKLAKAKAEAADKAKLQKLRADDLKRMMAGATGTTGSAAKSTAPRSDTGYLASITSKIKSTTTYAGSTDVPGNPKVSFRVEQLPTGEILSVKKIKSSGVPSFDDAVEKGIIKSSPLPKKKDGTVERSLVVDFSMKDLD